MVYENWEEKADFINSLQWYSLKETIEYLNDLTRFIIHTPGRTSEVQYPQLHAAKCDPPATKLNRCSPDDLYLWDGFGEWKLEMSLLQLGVNVSLNEDRCDRGYPFFKTKGEAEIYVLQKINELTKLVRKDKMRQSQFEYCFGLTWVDKEESNSNNPMTFP